MYYDNFHIIVIILFVLIAISYYIYYLSKPSVTTPITAKTKFKAAPGYFISGTINGVLVGITTRKLVTTSTLTYALQTDNYLRSITINGTNIPFSPKNNWNVVDSGTILNVKAGDIIKFGVANGGGPASVYGSVTWNNNTYYTQLSSPWSSDTSTLVNAITLYGNAWGYDTSKAVPLWTSDRKGENCGENDGAQVSNCGFNLIFKVPEETSLTANMNYIVTPEVPAYPEGTTYFGAFLPGTPNLTAMAGYMLPDNSMFVVKDAKGNYYRTVDGKKWITDSKLVGKYDMLFTYNKLPATDLANFVNGITEVPNFDGYASVRNVLNTFNNKDNGYIVKMELAADCCSWSSIRNIMKIYIMSLQDIINGVEYEKAIPISNTRGGNTCGGHYYWTAPKGMALCGIQTCSDSVNAKLIRSIRFLAADPVKNWNHYVTFDNNGDPTDGKGGNGGVYVLKSDGSSMFSIIPGEGGYQCNGGNMNLSSCRNYYKCRDYAEDSNCSQVIDGWLNSDFGFQSGYRNVSVEYPTKITIMYKPIYFVNNFEFSCDAGCDDNNGIGIFTKVTYFNTYGYFINSLSEQGCCMNLKNDGGLLTSNDISVCNALSLNPSSGGPWTNVCQTTMSKYCSLNPIDTRCITYCNAPNSNCDDNLKKYCGTIYNAKGMAGINDNGSIQNICSCFLPQSFYTNYYNSLNQKYPNVKSDLTNITPECAYSKCQTASIKSVTNRNTVCPNIAACFQNLKVDNYGTIEGGDIKSDQICNIYQNNNNNTNDTNNNNNNTNNNNNNNNTNNNNTNNKTVNTDITINKKYILILILVLIILVPGILYSDEIMKMLE